jgi:acetyltransferase-like isoleucine patch superfamily enzyme
MYERYNMVINFYIYIIKQKFYKISYIFTKLFSQILFITMHIHYLLTCFTSGILGSGKTFFIQHVLTFVIERKITLGGDVYSRPPINFRSHDLHVGNIKRVVGKMASCHERD